MLREISSQSKPDSQTGRFVRIAPRRALVRSSPLDVHCSSPLFRPHFARAQDREDLRRGLVAPDLRKPRRPAGSLAPRAPGGSIQRVRLENEKALERPPRPAIHSQIRYRRRRVCEVGLRLQIIQRFLLPGAEAGRAPDRARGEGGGFSGGWTAPGFPECRPGRRILRKRGEVFACRPVRGIWRGPLRRRSDANFPPLPGGLPPLSFPS